MTKNNDQVLGQAIMTIAQGNEKLAGTIIEKIKGDSKLVSQIQASIEDGANVDDLVNLISKGLGAMEEQQVAQHKMGAKIKYLNTLKGKCPEGKEIVQSKNGCKVCRKKKEFVAKEKCGAKMKPSKKENGGVLEMIKKYNESAK